MINSVERQFSRAAYFYDKNAKAQARISNRLFEILTSGASIPHAPKIVEFGCGTGNLTVLLNRLSPKKLLLNDICKEYTDILLDKLGADNYNYIKGDAVEILQQLINENAKFDIVASSSAIQWLRNPLGFLNSCSQLLNSGGVLAVSTFLPDNLFQLREVCDVTSPVVYNSILEIEQGLQENYRIVEINHSFEEMEFDSVNDVLRHLKYTGVNASQIDSQKPAVTWTRHRLQQLENNYREKFYKDGRGYPLTYSPVWILAIKK